MFDRLEAIAAEGARFADLAATTPGDTPVRSCPEWTARDLVAHLGEVQRSWAANVTAARPDQPPGDSQEASPSSDLSAWMRDSTEALLDALRRAGDAAPCWTWWGEPATAGAVARHQVQEAAVHRWDAEDAVGTAGPLDAEVAHDGVGEFVEIVIGDEADGLDGVVVLRSCDTGGEWSVGAGGIAAAEAGRLAEITATASDLVLLLYGRLPLSHVQVDGDRGVAEALVVLLETE
jgi:uncharacterized protein (TIGR03083 family)